VTDCRYNLIEDALRINISWGGGGVFADFHVPYSVLSMEPITTTNLHGAQQDEIFGIIRPFLSQDKTDGPIYLPLSRIETPARGLRWRASAVTCTPTFALRKYCFTKVVRQAIFATANWCSTVRFSGLLFGFFVYKSYSSL
jgi:hypothetical protein